MELPGVVVTILKLVDARKLTLIAIAGVETYSGVCTCVATSLHHYTTWAIWPIDWEAIHCPPDLRRMHRVRALALWMLPELVDEPSWRNVVVVGIPCCAPSRMSTHAVECVTLVLHSI